MYLPLVFCKLYGAYLKTKRLMNLSQEMCSDKVKTQESLMDFECF